MRMLRKQEVGVLYTDKVFKMGSLPNLIRAVIFFAIVAAFIIFHIKGKVDLKATCIFSVCFGLAGLLSVKMYTKNLSGDNWLVRAGLDGISLKFRSHLNSNFPADQCQAVSLRFDEIQSARIVQLTIKYIRMTGGKTRRTTKTNNYVELTVAGDSLGELKLALKREYTIKVNRRFHIYPVSVPNNNTIRLFWRHIRPGASKLIDLLESKNIRVEEKSSQVNDYINLDGLDDATIKDKLRELIALGERRAAMSVARRTYNIGISDSKKILDGLYD